MAELSNLQVIDEEIEDSSRSESESDSDDDFLEKDTINLENDTSRSEFLNLKQKLFEEFDSLGIIQSKDSNLSEVDLVMSAFNLVNIHRKVLACFKDGDMYKASLRTESTRLEKQVKSLKNTITEKEKIIENLNHQLILARMQCEDLQKEKADLQQNLWGSQKASVNKESEYERKVQQLEAEVQNLQDLGHKNIGKFTSADTITASVLQKFKAKEIFYKDTIKKLHENNQGLIRHLLNLLEQDLTNPNSIL